MGNQLSEEQRDIELCNAAEAGKVAKVGTLLKEGANPNRRLENGGRKSRTSLHQAAKTKNNVDVLTQLLGYIKDVDATDEDGNTALHLAAGYYNNVAVVQTLLHAGPNCKIQNSAGQTALHSAVKGGSDIKIIESLLRADSDPNISDFDGNTVLHLCASRRGNDPLVAGILLRFGGNPNLKNQAGETPLHVASKFGNKSVLLLLKFHAKVRLRDNEGRKPSDVAATEEIRNILLWEEKKLEERTVRMDSAVPFTASRPSSRMSMYSDGGNGFYGAPYQNDFNQINYSMTDGRSDYSHYWKGSGGDGVIHLPNNNDIVVPPQSVPYGTNFQVSLSPSSETEEVVDIDFDKVNFELDFTVELPGILFCAPWMMERSGASSPTLSFNSSTSPAFSGMCLEGRSKWKSIRELASQPNGILALRFKFSKEKTTPIITKPTPANRLSSTEIQLEKPLRPVANGSDDLDQIEKTYEEEDKERAVGAHDEGDAEKKEEEVNAELKEDLEVRSDAEEKLKEQEEEENVEEDYKQITTHDSEDKESVTSTSSSTLDQNFKESDTKNDSSSSSESQSEDDSDNDEKTKQQQNDDYNEDYSQQQIDKDDNNEDLAQHHDDLYDKLNNLPVHDDYDDQYDDALTDTSNQRYDRHPIDPALATITEETRSESNAPHGPREPPRYSQEDSEMNPGLGTYKSGYDVNMDDVDMFASASQQQRTMEDSYPTSDPILY